MKYITIEQGDQSAGKQSYYVSHRESGHLIARVEWKPEWDSYVVAFCEQMRWSAHSLEDVAAFVREVTAKEAYKRRGSPPSACGDHRPCETCINRDDCSEDSRE